jgi:hypothetical protein
MGTSLPRKVRSDSEETAGGEPLQWPPRDEDVLEVVELGGPEAAPRSDVMPNLSPRESEPGVRPLPAAVSKPDLFPDDELREGLEEVPPAAARPERRLWERLGPWRLRLEHAALVVLGLLVLAEGAFILRVRQVPPRAVSPQVARLQAPEGKSAVGTAGGAAAREGKGSGNGALDSAAGAASPTSAGLLTIRTEPAGAGVVLDGRSRGTAPVTVNGLQAGDHEVIVRTRHGEIRQRVRLGEGEAVSLVVPLGAARAVEAAEGGLSITAPVELRVFEGDRLLGTSAMERVPLAPGAHRLVFRNDDVGFAQARNVTVARGKAASVTVEIPAQRVAINATPWATVSVDGRQVGETPIGNLSLPVGPHAVVFRHPQLGEKSARLVVRANEPGRLSVDMRK